jgi:hypothetical protein
MLPWGNPGRYFTQNHPVVSLTEESEKKLLAEISEKAKLIIQ